MSTTPSTPDAITVVGPEPERNPDAISLVVLNRGSRHNRYAWFERAEAAPFHEIISVEAQERAYSVEPLTRRLQHTRFALVGPDADPAVGLRVAARIGQTDYLLVIWSTMTIPRGIERARAHFERSQVQAVGPALSGDRGEVIPCVHAPAANRRGLRVANHPPRSSAVPTLYLFEYVGLYRRSALLEPNGYDPQFTAPYWQRLDFGMRNVLWGNELLVEPAFRGAYTTMPEAENRTADADYARFYARNMALRFHGGGVVIPWYRPLGFALRARAPVGVVAREFSAAKVWVQQNRDRYTRVASEVVEAW